MTIPQDSDFTVWARWYLLRRTHFRINPKKTCVRETSDLFLHELCTWSVLQVLIKAVPLSQYEFSMPEVSDLWFCIFSENSTNLPFTAGIASPSCWSCSGSNSWDSSRVSGGIVHGDETVAARKILRRVSGLVNTGTFYQLKYSLIIIPLFLSLNK